MKKVLILANSSTGLYDFRNELVLELIKKYEVYASLPEREAADALEAEGCHVLDTRINRRGMNPLQDFRLLMDYVKMIRRLKPGCVLTYTIKPNIYGGLAAGLCKVPFIPTITGLGTAFQREGMVNKLVKFLYRTAFKRAKVVFFQNDRNKEIFREKKLLTGKVRVVPGSGVNLEVHRQEAYPGRERPRFLYVGRLMKEKGIEEFLHTAKTYANQAEFVIIGDYEEDYREQVERGEQEGWLDFKGRQRDMHSFYKEADAVIIASYHEGMSNVLLEAASTARPVLATDISGCREAVEKGVTGLIFSPESKEALEKAVGDFLKLTVKEREVMGKEARRKMEQEFDRYQVAGAYLEEIERAIKAE
ncbi:MAG: glycosyltransferase family 4 protein [Lachnospiraceae bacterium]|nr:glycosyltransferase family 4 protein [Lachnospiraceae bacterium]